jgi:hypothetical protein
MAWIAIAWWRRLHPPSALFIIGIVPAAFATLLALLGTTLADTEQVRVIAMVSSVAALIVPTSLMMRHQLARLIKFVFPRARLVRRRR